MTLVRQRLGRLYRCRRAAVAIYVALMAPVLAGAVALGVEVSSWSGAQADMQRAAEMGKHCAQTLGIDHMAGKIAELVADARELAA